MCTYRQRTRERGEVDWSTCDEDPEIDIETCLAYLRETRKKIRDLRLVAVIVLPLLAHHRLVDRMPLQPTCAYIRTYMCSHYVL